MSPALADGLFTTEPPRKPLASVLKLAVRNHLFFFSHVILASDTRLSKITTIAFSVFFFGGGGGGGHAARHVGS